MTDLVKSYNMRGTVVKADVMQTTTKKQVSIHVIRLEDKNELVLRRKRGPVYADKVLDKYNDKKVVVEGFMLGSTLLAEHIRLAGRPRVFRR